MNKFISLKNKTYKLLLILTSIILLYLCLFCFILKKPFLLGNDQWFQYNIFYKEWIRLVLEFFNSHSLPMYSWNMYLGTDFYSAMGYYCTGDIFLPILLIFKNNVEIGLIIETILCVYISAILISVLLDKLSIKNNDINILISIIYAFGGCASLYYGNYMFHRFYALLPLLFIGLINYFNNKKILTFIVATTILMLQNYYFMFPTLIFLLIISIAYEIKTKRTIKQLLKDFIVLLGCLILGFMISAVITLPSMMYLLNNTRVGNSKSTSIFWPLNTYAGLYMSLISFYPAELITNMFQNTSNYHTSFYSLFITILPVIGCFEYIYKKEHIVELTTLIVLTIIACLTPLSSIMHGFSVPSLRWIFLYELFILVLGAKGLDEHIEDKHIKEIYIGYIIIFLLFILLLAINEYIDITTMIEHIIIIVISIVFSLLIIILFSKNKKLAIIFSIIEVIAFEGYFLYIETRGSYIAENVIDSQEIEFAQANDEDTFRYYLNYKNNNPASYINQNESLKYNFMSVTSYNSLTDYNIESFNTLSGTSDINLDWVLQVNDPYAATMLGVKYYIVYKDNELPKELEFSYAYNFDYLSVYENLNYKGFGYTSDKLKYTKDFDSNEDFIDFILIDDENINITKYQNISYSKLNVISKYNNYFEANINLESDNILFIPIPNNSGWRIRVNGVEIEPISVNGGFIGLQLQKGNNEITMSFMSPYFKEGLILSTIGIIAFVCLICFEKKFILKNH